MKKITLTIIFLILTTTIFAQEENQYPSREEAKYYKKRSFEPFKPIDKQKIIEYGPEYLEIFEKEVYQPYIDSLYLTPYQDSIYAEMFNNHNDVNQFPKPEYIGKIDKAKIFKYEKSDSIEVFLYESFEYEDRYFGEPGIWIGYSNNGGESWQYFYTGIVQRQPIYLKWYSQSALIIKDNRFEIEGALLKQLEPFTHPGPSPKYECVKDGIAIVFDLSTLSKDTDGDGLTDIIEEKLGTTIQIKDTDNDGIADNLDLNPRKNLPKTEKSKIYEAILNEQIKWDSTGIGTIIEIDKKDFFVTDSTETVLIVTDNKDLMSVQPRSTRLIFISEKEYKNRKIPFKTELNEMHLTPLFKVDNMIDTYKITVSFNVWGTEYLVRKTKNGWMFEILSMWIS